MNKRQRKKICTKLSNGRKLTLSESEFYAKRVELFINNYTQIMRKLLTGIDRMLKEPYFNSHFIGGE